MDKRTPPSMLFNELIEAELEDALKSELNRLLQMKKELPEMGMAPKIQVFNDYIEKVLPEIKAIADSVEDNKAEWGALDEMFLRVVGGR